MANEPMPLGGKICAQSTHTPVPSSIQNSLDSPSTDCFLGSRPCPLPLTCHLLRRGCGLLNSYKRSNAAPMQGTCSLHLAQDEVGSLPLCVVLQDFLRHITTHQSNGSSSADSLFWKLPWEWQSYLYFALLGTGGCVAPLCPCEVGGMDVSVGGGWGDN